MTSPGPNKALYNPNSKTFPNICVEPGDRIIFVSMSFATPGPNNRLDVDANHLFPHWTYKPTELFEEDPRDATMTGNPRWGVNGYGGPKTLRFDWGAFYCPWSGVVNVDGGSVPDGFDGDILISFMWDRSPVQRTNWWQTLVNVMRGALEGHSKWSLAKMPRVPVEMRSLTEQTLTFYNLVGTEIAPVNITRPAGAWAIRTPNSDAITASVAATGVNLVTNFAQPIPVAALTNFQVTSTVPVMTFDIRY